MSSPPRSPLLVVLALAAGVLATGRSTPAEETAPAVSEPADRICGTEADSVALETRFAPSSLVGLPDGPALYLSGGSAYGAWGSGVLYGRAEVRDVYGDPEFPLVTGVSTGALMSSLVFLGGRDDYEALKVLYTETDEGDIQWLKPWFFLSDSIYSRGPLRELVEGALRRPDANGDSVFARVAAEAGGGRELWVGTVDLDTGQFCALSLSAIASKAPKEDPTESPAFTRYVDAVMASANMPVMAPPVRFDGDLLVDGGTRLQIFAKTLSLLARDAYLLVNGKVVVDPTPAPQKDELVPILTRSLAVVMLQALRGNLYRARRQLGPEYGLFVSRIPDDCDPGFAPEEFDPAKMSKLFEAGRAWGRAHVAPDDWPEWAPDGDLPPSARKPGPWCPPPE